MVPGSDPAANTAPCTRPTGRVGIETSASCRRCTGRRPSPPCTRPTGRVRIETRQAASMSGPSSTCTRSAGRAGNETPMSPSPRCLPASVYPAVVQGMDQMERLTDRRRPGGRCRTRARVKAVSRRARHGMGVHLFRPARRRPGPRGTAMNEARQLNTPATPPKPIKLPAPGPSNIIIRTPSPLPPPRDVRSQ